MKKDWTNTFVWDENHSYDLNFISYNLGVPLKTLNQYVKAGKLKGKRRVVINPRTNKKSIPFFVNGNDLADFLLEFCKEKVLEEAK